MQEIAIFIRLTRWNHWILNIGFVLAGFFLHRPEPGLYTLLLPIVVVFFFVESFGFAINDYFDAPFDKLKPITNNVISKGLLKRSNAAAFITFLLLFGLTFSFIYLPVTSFLLIALLYLLYFAYSSPPFRLKEKAFLGLIAHGAWSSLLLLASSLIVSPLKMVTILMSIIAFFLSVLVCITQEVKDMDPDRKAKFRTTTIALGYRHSLNLIKVIFILANAIFFVAVILYLPLYMLLLMASSVFYLKLLFSNPPQRILFQKTLRSWDKGIAVAFIMGIIMLPFYLGIL